MLILVVGVTAAGAAAGFLIAGSVTASLRRLTAAAEAVETHRSTRRRRAGGRQRRGRPARRRVPADARRARSLEGGPATAGPGRRTRVADTAHQPAHQPRRVAPLPGPPARSTPPGGRRSARRDRGARRCSSRRWSPSPAVGSTTIRSNRSRSVTSPVSWRRGTNGAAAGEVRVEADESPVEGQLGAVQRAISNLLDNAAQVRSERWRDRRPSVRGHRRGARSGSGHRRRRAGVGVRALPPLGGGADAARVRGSACRSSASRRAAPRHRPGRRRATVAAPPSVSPCPSARDPPPTTDVTRCRVGPTPVRAHFFTTVRFRAPTSVHRFGLSEEGWTRRLTTLTGLLRGSGRPHTGGSHHGPQEPSGRTDTSDNDKGVET